MNFLSPILSFVNKTMKRVIVVKRSLKLKKKIETHAKHLQSYKYHTTNQMKNKTHHNVHTSLYTFLPETHLSTHDSSMNASMTLVSISIFITVFLLHLEHDILKAWHDSPSAAHELCHFKNNSFCAVFHIALKNHLKFQHQRHTCSHFHVFCS